MSEKPQVTIPLAIVEDVRTFRPEDTPDEFLEPNPHGDWTML
jgi:hypothetical protein